ncbi:MAG TPA: SDR family oxidoreductase [Solirubrobacteraceae bacterium]|nr:SDR family oxidoreductase [Solirubrobacteraceae bacterium]
MALGENGATGATLIVGGTRGIGRRLAEQYAGRGRRVVITGRDRNHTEAVAREIGAAAGVALDLTEPTQIGSALKQVGTVDHVVLAAIERDSNTVREYEVERAIRLATLKLVGYTEVLHSLCTRMHDNTAVLLFGGLAKDRPYPGSTTVTSVNGAVTTMVRTLATELAPVRVNALHPGVVGDSPAWIDATEFLKGVKERTPTGRLVTMDEVTNAAVFLLENTAVNGVNLHVDGGWVLS